MKKILTIGAMLLTSGLSYAGPQCETLVTTLRVSNTGGLYLSAESISNGQYILLCSVASDINTASSETCKSWQSLLQAAQVARKRVSVSYKYENSTTVPSCDAVPVSNPPTPYFVQLIHD